MIEAESMEALPVMSCSYDIQVYYSLRIHFFYYSVVLAAAGSIDFNFALAAIVILVCSCACHYIVITQIHSIGCYGASHPLQETYAINTECKECFPISSCIAMMVLKM